MTQKLTFIQLDQIDPTELLPILNKATTREHLVDHDQFDLISAKSWIKGKLDVDSTPGCRVRAVKVDDTIAGWCGLQLELDKYEIAIVIDDGFWGIGKRIFAEIVGWAQEFGHESVCIHLLHTRPEYKFLRKMASRVYQSELLGDQFTTYELSINQR